MDDVTLEESVDKYEVLLGVTVQYNLKWSEQMKTLMGKLKKKIDRFGENQNDHEQVF